MRKILGTIICLLMGAGAAAQDAHDKFFDYGFNISGPDRVAYEVGETVQFNLDYLNSSVTSATWEIRDAADESLDFTLSGTAPTLQLTAGMATKAYDVRCYVNFGIYQTFFDKPGRIFVVPSTQSGTYTLSSLSSPDQFQGHTIVTAVGSEHSFDGQYFSPGDVIYISANLTSNRIRLLNFNGTASEPIIITTPTTAQVVLDKTAGGQDDILQIRDGCNHLYIYSKKNENGVRSLKLTDGGISAAQVLTPASSGHGIKIFGLEVASGQSAGIKMKFDAVNRATGSFDDLWVFDNHVYSCTNEGLYIGYFTSSFDYTFNTNSSFNSTSTTSVDLAALGATVTITVGIGESYIAAHGVKLASAANSSNFFQGKVVAYNSGTGQLDLEKVQKGGSGTHTDWNLTIGDYHHTMNRPWVWANRAELNGWDGIQCGNCKNARVVYNLALNNATAEVGSQNFSYSINSGFSGVFTHNISVGHGMQLLPESTTIVTGNVIYGVNSQNGIFLRRADNADFKDPLGNAFTYNDASTELHVVGNTLVSEQDPVYLLVTTDFTGAGVNVAELIYANNLIHYTGSPVTGQLRITADPASIVVNNIITATYLDLMVDIDEADVDLPDNTTYLAENVQGVDRSSVAQNPIDVSAQVSVTSLPGAVFTDINGQHIPIRGYWKYGHTHRRENHEMLGEPNASKSSVQWYQTAEPTGTTWPDKVKIPDMYGSRVKRYALIGGSAKPRYLMSVRPAARTGRRIGAETFDTQSHP